VERGFRKLEAARAVGEIPAQIPSASRRASVCCDLAIKLDPGKHPDAAAAAVEDDADPPLCILTVVLVEEAGGLRVGHHFLRWYDILD
jgi:hypothetical protein